METYTLKTLREELRRVLACGWRQQEVANAIGVAQSAISMFVSGKRGLQGDAALRLLGFLRSRDNDEDTLSGERDA